MRAFAVMPVIFAVIPLVLILGCSTSRDAPGFAGVDSSSSDDDDATGDDDDAVPNEDTLPPIESGDWQMVSAGDFHTCAINPDLELVCWGWNDHDQADPPEGTFSSVGLGWSHTCAMRVDGTLACWGVDHGSDYGQAEPPEGDYTQLAVGSHHNCVLNDAGESEGCWGRSDHGQLDIPDRTWNLLDGGKFSTCGLDSGGALTCWGEAQSGETSAPGGTWETFGMGETSACAIDIAGNIECWGLVTEVEDPPDDLFLEVACGKGHCCALSGGGEIQCWGNPSEGLTEPPEGESSRSRAAARIAAASPSMGCRSVGAPTRWTTAPLPARPRRRSFEPSESWPPTAPRTVAQRSRI